MLEKISKILYVFLSVLFIFLVSILGIKSKIKIDSNIIYIIILLLFPFLNELWNTIKTDVKKINLNIKYSNNIIKYFIILLFFIILYFLDRNIQNIFILIFILFGLLFKIDSRISFFIALIFLLFTPVYLFIGDKKIAEILSINAYYFLIIGVIFELKENLFDKSKNSEKDKNYNSYYEKFKIKKNNLTNNGISLFEEYYNFLMKKYYEIRNNILIEIGEKNRIKELDCKKNKNKNYTNNLFIKLIKYFFNKIVLNLENIFYILFIINSILVILMFKFDLLKIINVFFVLLIILYIFLLFLGKTNLISSLNFKNIYYKNYFFNKAIIFGLLGITASSFVLTYLNINKDEKLIYIYSFLLFFLIFYISFASLDIKNFLKIKINKIKNIKIKVFLKKHIYLLLSLLVISIITFNLGNKIDNLEQNGKNDDIITTKINENKTVLIKDKNIDSIFKDEKEDKIEILKKQLISGETSIIDNNIKNKKLKTINVANYYKFNRNLRLGSRNIDVKKLEEILKKLDYFNGEPDIIFDLDTKNSLTLLLKKECGWPKTTKGILGNQAKKCLYSLKIKD